MPDIDISLFFECVWLDKGQSLFEKVKSRIKCAYNALVHGFVHLEEEFLFRDKQHLDDFIKALLEAKKEIEDRHKA